MTRPNPCRMRLRKVTFKDAAMKSGKLPDNGKDAWSLVRRSARIATGSGPSGFKVFNHSESGELIWLLKYGSDPEIREARAQRSLESQARQAAWARRINGPSLSRLR